MIAVVMAYALAEMAVVHPVAGSFGIYAETYLSPWAGFTVRATYGLAQIIAIGAEVTAVAIPNREREETRIQNGWAIRKAS